MRRFVSLVVALATTLPGVAPAALAQLTAAQIQEAIAHGHAVYEERKAKAQAIDDLEEQYVIDRGPAGRVALQTEFGTVALEACRWRAIGRELSSEHVQTVLRPLQGHLQFSVTLPGTARDFLRHHAVRLVQRDRDIRPASWDVYRGTPTEPGRYVASGIYRFPTADLDLGAPVTLVVKGPEGPEERFAFDLGRLR